jgi:hypothetical protein
MEDFNKIRSRLFFMNPDAATAEAFDRAIDSGSIMRDNVCPVLDANGNPLIVGAIYQYQRRHTSLLSKSKSVNGLLVPGICWTDIIGCFIPMTN